MKFFKAVLVVLLLIVGGLLLLGVFVPEMDEQIEVRVEKPIVTVYASMLNTGTLTDWMVDLESVERTSGFLAMPGSTFTLGFKSKEVSGVYQMEVIQVVPMESFRVRIYNEMIDLDANIRFEADGLTATNVTAYFQIKGKGLLERSMLPLMKGVIADELAQNLQNFKQYQEQE